MLNDQVVTILSAIAQDNRLKILKMIIQSSEEGICPCEMMEKLDMTNGGLSSHLKVLENSGVIGSQKRGKFIYYFSNCELIKQVGDFLIQDCSKFKCCKS